MATNKLNARSPYFIQATGTAVVEAGQEEEEEIPLSIKIVQINADNTQTESPGEGDSEQNITLRAIANFTPANNVYTWTANSGTSLGTSVDATFTETLVNPITQQQYEYTVSAVTSDGETITSQTFLVSWVRNVTQYRAELEVINDILPSFSSAGYDLSITMNATNQNAITHSTSDGTLGKTEELTRAVTGIQGDTYSFTLTLTVKTGFTANPALAISTATHTGTFGTSNVSLTSTLTGTLIRDAVYILSADTTVITEGCPFTVSLSTTNLPNGSSVPFTITGVSAGDLVRGNLSGAFLVQNNFAQIQFEAVSDAINELPNETFILSLTGIPNTSPNVSQISVDIYDNITTGTANAQPNTANLGIVGIGPSKTGVKPLYGNRFFGGNTKHGFILLIVCWRCCPCRLTLNLGSNRGKARIKQGWRNGQARAMSRHRGLNIRHYLWVLGSNIKTLGRVSPQMVKRRHLELQPLRWQAIGALGYEVQLPRTFAIGIKRTASVVRHFGARAGTITQQARTQVKCICRRWRIDAN